MKTRAFTVRFTAECDPLLAIGVRVPELVALPFVDAFQIHSDAVEIVAVDLDEGTPFPAMAPRAFLAWIENNALTPQRSGPCEALPEEHVDFPAVLAGAKADLAERLRGFKPANAVPGGPFDFRGEYLHFAIQLMARSWGIGETRVHDLVKELSPYSESVTREMIANAYEDGIALPHRLALEVIEQETYRRSLQKREDDARAAAAARLAAPKHRPGLARLLRHPPIGEEAPNELERITGALQTIPQGFSFVDLRGLPGVAGGIAPGLWMDQPDDPIMLNDEEAGRLVQPLSEQMAVLVWQRRELIRREREGFNTPTYDETSLVGDIRTPAGRHAATCMAVRAGQLARLLASSAAGDARFHKLVHSAFWTLAVAYQPHVDALNAVDILFDAYRQFAPPRFQVQLQPWMTGPMVVGGPAPRPADDAAARDAEQVAAGLSQHLGVPVAPIMGPMVVPSRKAPPAPAPRRASFTREDAQRLMLQSLSEGSIWSPGELFVPPTAAEARAIAKALNPKALERAVSKLVGDVEIKTDDVYRQLFELGVTGSNPPSTDDRKRVSVALEAEAYTKVTVERGGQRYRAWIRAAGASRPGVVGKALRGLAAIFGHAPAVAPVAAEREHDDRTPLTAEYPTEAEMISSMAAQGLFKQVPPSDADLDAAAAEIRKRGVFHCDFVRNGTKYRVELRPSVADDGEDDAPATPTAAAMAVVGPALTSRKAARAAVGV